MGCQLRLIDRGANLNVDILHDCWTPMSAIVSQSDPSPIEELLCHPFGIVDVSKGELLFEALKRETGVVPVLQLLLDRGTSINASRGGRLGRARMMSVCKQQGPPLHFAAFDGNMEAVRYLLVRDTNVTIRDPKGVIA